MTTNYYENLNLEQGASLSDIKAAYRRLAKENHPDIIGNNPDKVNKFIEAHQAYMTLLKEKNRELKTQGSFFKKECFEALKVEQNLPELDTYHTVKFEGSKNEGEKLIVSLTINEVCPVCFGQGKTLLKTANSNLLKSHHCPKCGGHGVVRAQKTLAVIITEEIMKAGKVRLKKAGHYHPKPGCRGDLVITLQQTSTH